MLNYKCTPMGTLGSLILQPIIQGSRVWSMREADRILAAVVLLIQESSGEARAQGRRTLYLLHTSDPDEFERALKRQCNDVHQRKCRDILEKIKNCGDPLSLGAKKASPSTKVCNGVVLRKMYILPLFIGITHAEIYSRYSIVCPSTGYLRYIFMSISYSLAYAIFP